MSHKNDNETPISESNLTTSYQPSVTMKLSTILSAIALPVLAMAQDGEADSTTTMTSTTTLTKTVTLTNTVLGSTASAEPTASNTGTGSVTPTSSATEDEDEPEPTGAAAGLDASRVALAGVAGMVVVALM